MKKIPKLLALLLCLVMCVSLIPAAAAADDVIASGECGLNLKYELTEDGTLTVSGTGEMVRFSELPDRPRAWQQNNNYKKIKKVVICDGVTSIGEFAFYMCENLETVEIADSVTEIGRCAFTKCVSLVSVKIPDGVTEIASNTFSACYSLKSVVLPEGLTRIGDSAFLYCGNLESINFPDSLTAIGHMAFEDCTSITEVNLPASLEILDFETDFNYAFPGCPISKITVDSANRHYSTDESGQVLFNKDKTVLLYAVKSLSGEYTVPGTVKAFEYGAFTDCTKLTKVTLPEGLTEIKDYCYSGCTALESVVIPDSVTRIGYASFQDCVSLKSITIPEKVTGIPNDVFRNCSSLETITVPKGIEYIESGAFTGCTSLEGFVVDAGNEYFSVDEKGVLFNKDKTALIAAPGTLSGEYALPDSVKSIYPFSLNGCPNLTGIALPAAAKFGYEDDSPYFIDNFTGCRNLSSIRVDPGNPYYTSDEKGVLFSKDKSLLLFVPGAYKGTFTVPASVEEIGGSGFYACTGITGIVSDSENFCTDENGVLFDAGKTTLIKAPVTLSGDYTVPDSVNGFINGAFLNCSALESISFPGVGFFYIDAFEGCSDQLKIIFSGNMPAFVSFNVNSPTGFAGALVYPAFNPTWERITDYIDTAKITLAPYGFPGDVNLDGELTNTDLILVARFVVQLIDPDSAAYENVERFGDVDGDGAIGNTDIISIARAIVGLDG